MNTHYIPQYYLKAFQTKAGNNCVVRYEKGSRTAKELPIKVVGSENDLYPAEVETFLNEEYEKPANRVLDKLRKQELPTDEDRRALVQYFLLMKERTPFSKEKSIEMLREMIPERLQFYESEKTKLLVDFPEKREIIEENIAYLRKLLTTSDALKERVWLTTLGKNNFPQSYNALLMMNWYFVMSHNADRFITSDAPFFFTSGIGLNKRSSEVFFPVSTRVVIWLNRYSLKREVIEASQSITNEINKRLVYNAVKYIFFSQEVEWLKHYCMAHKLDLRTLDLKSLMKN